MSVMEISHRSKTFEDLLGGAIADIRELAGMPSDYTILMLQGGASLQFSMVPMNLLSPGSTADYIDTGTWADKAVKEAARVGTVNVTGSTKADNYNRIPTPGEIALTPGAAYVHFTTNNTIEGTEWRTPPDVGDAPLVADASSDIFSRPIDVRRFGLIYGGAQKNLGPSGVTLVIMRNDLLARSSKSLPTMLNYKVMAENNSLYNTPNTFGIYILGLTMKWLKSLGGLAAIGETNARKAAQALRRDRPHRVLPRDRAEGQPLADERHVPAAVRGPGEALREGGHGGRSGRPQGPSIGGRHARVDLQRVPGGGRGRARAVHARVRAEERVGTNEAPGYRLQATVLEVLHCITAVWPEGDRMTKRIAALAVVMALGSGLALHAQWVPRVPPGTPLGADGRPNLTAPAPRGADGKPDFSGIWTGDGLQNFRDLASEISGGAPMQPWAEALYKERLTGKHAWIEPDANCLPQGVPKITLAPAPWKFIPLPGTMVILYEAFGQWRQIQMDGRALVKESEPELARLLVGAVGRRHAGRDHNRLQRQDLARHRRAPDHRGADRHRALPPAVVRAAGDRSDHRRRQGLYKAVERDATHAPLTRHRADRVRVSGEREISEALAVVSGVQMTSPPSAP